MSTINPVMNNESVLDESKRQELFAFLLDLLNQFSGFCKEHNLTYYAFAGTLLGTIRHKGIIPWDDDIDLIMKREDYNRMIDIISSTHDCHNKYQFMNTAIDPFFPKGFTRLTNTETTVIPYKDALLKYNHGCFIDIFPIDNIPDQRIVRLYFLKKIRILIGLLQVAGRFQSDIGAIGLPTHKKIMYYLLLPLFKSKKIDSVGIYNALNSFSSKYNNRKTKEAGTVAFSGENPRFIYDSIWYSDKPIVMPFNNTSIFVPRQYDAILTKSYGEYMTPVHQPSEHGETIIDLEIGYKEFTEQHKEDLRKLFLQTVSKK